MILDSFSVLPDEVEHLVNNSFLTDKLKRTYLRIVQERIQRFDRKSEWEIFWSGEVSIHGQSPWAKKRFRKPNWELRSHCGRNWIKIIKCWSCLSKTCCWVTSWVTFISDSCIFLFADFVLKMKLQTELQTEIQTKLIGLFSLIIRISDNWHCLPSSTWSYQNAGLPERHSVRQPVPHERILRFRKMQASICPNGSLNP